MGGTCKQTIILWQLLWSLDAQNIEAAGHLAQLQMSTIYLVLCGCVPSRVHDPVPGLEPDLTGMGGESEMAPKGVEGSTWVWKNEEETSTGSREGGTCRARQQRLWMQRGRMWPSASGNLREAGMREGSQVGGVSTETISKYPTGPIMWWRMIWNLS